MALVCLDWETAHLHGEAWISQHRLRHRLFVRRHGWDVPTYNDLEYDQFDTPAAKYLIWLDQDRQARAVARLIPTDRPYMIKEIWPEFVDGPLPQCRSIWEASRFGCDRDLPPASRRRAVAEIICGCLEFGVRRGVGSYLCLMPMGIFSHVIAPSGCPLTLLGSPRRMGRHPTAAAYITVSAEVLAEVRRRAGLPDPVLAPAEPPPARRIAPWTIGTDPSATPEAGSRADSGAPILAAVRGADCERRGPRRR